MRHYKCYHLLYFVLLLIFILSIAFAENQQGTELPTYWQLLTQNKIEEAKAELKQASPDRIFSFYEAESIINLLDGDYDAMLLDWLNIIKSSPDNPLSEVYIRRINELKVLLPNYEKTIHTYQNLLDSGINTSLNKALILDYLTEDYLNRDELKKAKVLISKSGFVTHWMYVAGPFAKDGETDMEYPFPIEVDDDIQNYSDKLIKLSSDINPYSKYLSFSSYIFPNVAIAYAYTSIECDAEQEIIVRLITQEPTKLWINGELVIYKNPNIGDYRNECLAEAKLKKGQNNIVVKMHQTQGEWRFGLQLINKENKDFSVRYSKIEKPIFKVAISNSNTLTKWAQIGCLKILNGKSDLISLLQKYYYFSSIDDFEPAGDALESAKNSYPDFIYIFSQTGRLDIIESTFRTHSKIRLENDAKKSYNRILELEPNSLVAYQGIGLFHYLQKRYDEAITNLKKELELKDNFFQANYFLSLAYAGKGWETEKIDSLKKVLQQFPSHQSSTLDLIDYFISKGLYDEAEKVALDGLGKGVAFKEIAPKLITIYRNSGNDSELLKLLEKLVQRNPDDVNSLQMMAKTYKKNGQLKKAIKTCQDILNISPQNYNAEKELGESYILSGSEVKGLTHISNALQKNPGDYSTRTLYESYSSLEPFYKKYDINLDTRQGEKYTKDKYPRASEALLIDVSVFQIHSDGSFEEMTHQAVKILNKEGRENWAEMLIPSNAELLLARTISPDGQIYEPENVQYLDTGITLSMPNLEDNAIVEYAYVRSVSNTYSFWRKIINTSFYFQQLENPVAISRLVLINSNQHTLKIRLNPTDFEPKVTDDKDNKIYIWEKQDISGLKDEPQMPDFDEISPNVKFYSDLTFDHILNYRLSHIDYKLITNEKIINKAEEITKSFDSKIGKIEAVYNYIRDEIKDSYNGGDATDVFELQMGNSVEKICLMYEMLRAIGIECYFGLTTSDIGQEDLTVPRYNIFHDPFLYVPSLDGEDCWIEFTSKYAPFMNAEKQIKKRIAAVYFDNKPLIIQLGNRELDEGWVETIVKNQIASDGIITLGGELIINGNYNNAYRYIFSDPKRKDLIAQMSVLKYYEKLMEPKIEIVNEEELNKNVIIKFSGTLKDVLQEEKEGLALKPFPNDINLSSFVTSDTREFDYENKDLSYLEYNDIEYELPENLIVSHLPDDYIITTPYGNYAITYQLVNNLIKIRRSAIINGIKVKKERWDEFIKFCRDADNHDKQRILLKKISN